MTRNTANALAASILSALLDMPAHTGPTGPMYAAGLNTFTLAEFELVIDMLQLGQLVTKAGHTLTLTPKGVAMAERVNQAAGIPARV